MQGASTQVIEKFEIIKSSPMFKHLAYNELIKVLNVIEIKKLEAGVTLMEKDSVSHEMFIIIQGGVAVKIGQEVISHGGRGEVLGEMGLFNNAPRSATVVTTEKTQVMILQRAALFKLMREDEKLAVKLCWSVIEQLSQRVRNLGEEMVEAKKLGRGVGLEGELPFVLGE